MDIELEQIEELIEGVNARYCTCCKELLSFSLFHKAKNGKYGHAAQCKPCDKLNRGPDGPEDKIKRQQYYKENKERISASNRANREANLEYYKEKAREYYRENFESISLKAKIFRENNKELLSIRSAVYREKQDKEVVAEYFKEYYKNNREILKEKSKKRYQENIQYIKAYTKKYRSENREKFNHRNSLRRAALLQRVPEWLTEEDKKSIEDFYILARELSKVTGVEFQVDHIIPLQGELVSGLHVPSNLQILTASENASKQNKFTID